MVKITIQSFTVIFFEVGCKFWKACGTDRDLLQADHGVAAMPEQSKRN
jgi:hypothetical protein